MANDLEIQAITDITLALDKIDDAARQRVLGWAAQRYKVSGTAAAQVVLGREGSPAAGALGVKFDAFVDLFDASGPRTDAERALVGGYWFQVSGEGADFQSQQVNDVLKDV